MGERRTECGRDGRRDLRPAKGRRRVPGVFDRRRVVGVEAPDGPLAEQRERIGVTHVRGVDERRGVAGESESRVAGYLDERAEIADEAAGDEAGHLLRDEIVVGVQSGAGGASWSDCVWVKLGMYIMATGGPCQSPPPPDVAADLKSTAVRRQLRKGGVTGGARLAGLASVTRQRLGGAGADREEGRGRSDDGGEAETPNAFPFARTVALVIGPPGVLDRFAVKRRPVGELSADNSRDTCHAETFATCRHKRSRLIRATGSKLD